MATPISSSNPESQRAQFIGIHRKKQGTSDGTSAIAARTLQQAPTPPQRSDLPHSTQSNSGPHLSSRIATTETGTKPRVSSQKENTSPTSASPNFIPTPSSSSEQLRITVKNITTASNGDKLLETVFLLKQLAIERKNGKLNDTELIPLTAKISILMEDLKANKINSTTLQKLNNLYRAAYSSGSRTEAVEPQVKETELRDPSFVESKRKALDIVTSTTQQKPSQIPPAILLDIAISTTQDPVIKAILLTYKTALETVTLKQNFSDLPTGITPPSAAITKDQIKIACKQHPTFRNELETLYTNALEGQSPFPTPGFSFDPS